MSPSDSKPRKYYEQNGFGLGTAILTAAQLKDVHALLAEALGRLGDPTITVLQEALEKRLELAGIEVESHIPVRAFANRSIIDHDRADDQTLAHKTPLAKVERAILERRKVYIKDPRKGEIAAWPLQILFHNIAWYLAYESTDIRPVINVTRLDRLQLISVLSDQRRVKDMRASQETLQCLCRRSGGIFLGDDPDQQKAVAEKELTHSRINLLVTRGTMQCVRFHCTREIFPVFLQGNNRFPSEQMRLSAPLPDEETPWQTQEGLSLQPDPNSTHPYPVELVLPVWTVTEERDFRRWLFGFGNRIRIEAPTVLREEHLRYGQGIAALYAQLPDPSAAEAEQHSPAG